MSWRARWRRHRKFRGLYSTCRWKAAHTCRWDWSCPSYPWDEWRWRGPDQPGGASWEVYCCRWRTARQRTPDMYYSPYPSGEPWTTMDMGDRKSTRLNSSHT